MPCQWSMKPCVMHQKAKQGQGMSLLTFTVTGRGGGVVSRALSWCAAVTLGLIGLLLVGALWTGLTHVAVDLVACRAVHWNKQQRQMMHLLWIGHDFVPWSNTIKDPVRYKERCALHLTCIHYSYTLRRPGQMKIVWHTIHLVLYLTCVCWSKTSKRPDQMKTMTCDTPGVYLTCVHQSDSLRRPGQTLRVTYDTLGVTPCLYQVTKHSERTSLNCQSISSRPILLRHK